MPIFQKTVGVLILLFAISISTRTFAQEPVEVKRSENKVIVEGKIYYIHVVKPGQTLYSISRAYNVTEKDIVIENPGASTSLKIGQPLKIPSVSLIAPNQNIVVDSSSYIKHTLQPKENIYALARNYNVSVKDIQAVNPGLDYDVLDIGQVILIPRAIVVFRDEDFILHKIRRKETLFGLAQHYKISIDDIYSLNPDIKFEGFRTGKIIRIPKQITEIHPLGIPEDTLPSDTYVQGIIDSIPEMNLTDYRDSLISIDGRHLKVAFMIPFNYKGQKQIIISDKEDTEINEDEPTIENDDLPWAVNFLEFFEGSLLAIDSLKREGLSLDVHYFDTQRSSSRVKEIIRSGAIDDVDIIIGPFYSWNVEIVNDFSRRKHIPMVSPFLGSDSLIKENPYFFQMNPSVKTIYSIASDYLARDYNKNLVFIHSGRSSLAGEVAMFKESLLKSMSKYTFPENVVIKEIIYNNAAKANLSSDIQLTLSKDKKNIIIIPDDDEAFVSTVITQLYFQLKNFDIEVFGTPYFSSFQNIDYKYYHELGLKYLSPYNFSYTNPDIEAFLYRFKSDFYAEPSIKSKKGCMYAFLGYDISMYFLHLLPRFQSGFVEHLNDSGIENLMANFRFSRPGLYGGFENEGLELIKYQPDFSIEVEPYGNNLKETELFTPVYHPSYNNRPMK